MEKEGELGTEGFWAKQIAEEAIGHFPGKQVINGGWSPSGDFHIGNAREIITAYAIHHHLQIIGEDSELKFVIDNFDSFDRIPSTMKSYKNTLRPFLGKPINQIPDPTGQSESYADRFSMTFVEAMQDWGLDVNIHYASEMYKAGLYDEYLKLFLEKEEEIQQIMEKVAGNRLDSFVNVVCTNCGNLRTTTLLGIDGEKLIFKCETKREFKGCGFQGETSINEHNWKLKWRLDWPARQKFLGVTVEPAGKDHSVAGGSIDTTIEIHRKIFNATPPIMPRYGFITMKGKKLSGSKGTGIPAKDLRKLLDPQAYFFLVFKNDLRKDVDFNYMSPDYMKLVDEFVMSRRMLNGYQYPGTTRQLEKLKMAVRLALKDKEVKVIPADISTSELLLIYQITLRDKNKTIEKFKELGKIKPEDSLIELSSRLDQTSYWLDKYAPNAIKFKVLNSPPEKAREVWDAKMQELWLSILDQIKEEMSKDDVMALIRDTAKSYDIPIKSVFQAFYLLLLGKTAGPNAAQFLLTLGTEKVKQMINLL
ncbi:MAG: lysine--tRNA ligase [Methanobacteriota archaeon]|nr:MAG: lysine--tRNA ligase [Euryarchaeota archaeon]